MQIAQTARTLLEAGFEHQAAIGKPPVTVGLFHPLAGQKGRRIHGGREVSLQSGGEFVIPAQEADLKQVGLDGDVFFRLLQAFGQTAHAVTHRQAAIPEQTNQGLKAGQIGLGQCVVDQDQEVDVRLRKLFAAPVAAHGDQRSRGG